MSTVRIVRFERGMRVVTPTGRVARVEGIKRAAADEMYSRIELLYHDAPDASLLHLDANFTVTLQGKLLKPYEGPPVTFPDERRAALVRLRLALEAEAEVARKAAQK
jgi:hypothetical protein